MTINPDVLLTLSRTGRVLLAEGLNGDGKALLQGCAVSGKNDLDTAEALMQRASGQGYLKDGGTVKLDVASANADWAEKLGRNLSEAMKRPQADIWLLEDAGFSSVSVDTQIGERVWDEAEKVNYVSTPLFLLRAVK